MAISSPIALVQAQLLTASAAVYYTTAANKRTLVNSATLHNADTAATILATVYVVPSGGSVGDATEVTVLSILPKESVPIFELTGRALAAGATIQAIAGTAAKVSLNVTGTEFAVTS